MTAPPLEPEEREWLIERTAELIAAAGWERYVEAPLVLPDAHSFPDRWTPDVHGLRVLALRLLAHAGLEQLDVEVTVFAGDRATELDAHGNPRVTGHQGAAAWFAGIQGDVCLFGCEVDQLQDAIGVAGSMAHEVAHAFRRFHGLEVDDRELEERLTDLTTVYLGFGVISTNAALRHRSSAVGDSLFAHQWSRNQLGYLPAAAMSFLLAMWWFARGDERAGARRIQRLLEVNQAAWFRGALTWLRKHPQELAAVTVREEHLEIVEGEVFRVARRRPWEQPVNRLARIGLFMSLGWVTGVVMLGGLTTLGGLLWLFSSSTWSDRCSDPTCDHDLSASDLVCPGCRRRIAGVIAHRNQRLTAQERR
jgi:hypothetical protein